MTLATINFSASIRDATYIIGLVILATGAFFIIKSKNIKAQQDEADRTIKLLQDNNDALFGKVTLLEQQVITLDDARVSGEKKILALEQTIKEISSIPLEAIEQHMAKTNQILTKLLERSK